jgi:hypothetical protein
MECVVCFEIYNDSLKKPYSLYGCGHTFCVSCIKRLKTQRCPLCTKLFWDIIPCYAILQIINDPANETQIAKPIKKLNKRHNKCSICRVEGHNRKSCNRRTLLELNQQSSIGTTQH